MLLRALREIEAKMGSRKLMAKGPRLIDMDILLYGGSETIDTPELKGPHPRMHLRRVGVVPLGQIAPGVGHPEPEKTWKQFVEGRTDRRVGRTGRPAT